MTLADIIILVIVVILLGLIIYFSIIRPKIKKENTCCKCPYSKQCKNINHSNCKNNDETLNKK